MSRAQDFVHLHTHSHYSLLSALPKIEELVAAAKADGQRALALTDAGNLYGAIDFYKECKKQGIKPIIGVDLYVAPRTRHDKEHRVDDRTSRLVLLAKNKEGYHNLLKLVSRAYLEGFYYTPRADRELIAEHRAGLIAIIPSFAGEATQHLRDGDRERAEESLAWYRETFGGNLYAEITHHPEIEGHEERMTRWDAFAKERGVPLVAAHDTYYLKPEDAIARELVVKIKNGGTLDRELGVGMEDFSFISSARAAELFRGEEKLIANAHAIAGECNLELALGKWFFPDFPLAPGKTHNEMLRDLTYAGFEKRGMAKTDEVVARVEHELSIISKKGYSPYFLVVADLLSHAAAEGIFTNTRGSAAGSLVSYLTGITTVDPLEFQLPFERFLNPDRPSPPDIDMDLADNRRDDLIDYVRQKYGETHVAQIGTFGTMMARAAVRDVARALGHSYGTGDQLARLIPFGKQGFPVTIDGAMKEVADLRHVYESDPEAREILDLAQKIEGNARHVGVHAAGVVIAPTPVTDFVPIQLDPKGGKIITQYDMYAVEEAGLLKFDFLGLKNLAILADSVARVRARLGTDVDINRLPKNDPKTFAMLSRGETLGVFQMASAGMTSYLVKLKPTRVDDLNVMVALYRPGPMNNIDEYIARKHGTAKVSYLHPNMQSYLDKTFGVLVYQDDLLMTAIEIAGYNWGDVDKFRKAVGKKIPEEMAKQHVMFVEGCMKHSGMKKTDAEALWQLFEPFQGYGFNKAHAASYGNLAYQTAYMKANYSVDYMAALLTADAGDVEEVGAIVAECKRMGLEVLAPDVNESMRDFTVVGKTTIRFGLNSIKNFGEGVAQSIINARKKGKFASLSDFLARVPDKNPEHSEKSGFPGRSAQFSSRGAESEDEAYRGYGKSETRAPQQKIARNGQGGILRGALNKKSLEALIQCGAMDGFGERGAMLAGIESLLEYHKEHMGGPIDQSSLFGGKSSDDLHLPKAAKASFMQKLQWEKELLGLYISGHPLDAHRAKLEKQKFDVARTKEKLPPDTQTTISGIIETRRDILTKNGEKMAFLTIADYGGTIEAVAFPRILKEYNDLLIHGECVLLRGRLSLRNGEMSFIAEDVRKL